MLSCRVVSSMCELALRPIISYILCNTYILITIQVFVQVFFFLLKLADITNSMQKFNATIILLLNKINLYNYLLEYKRDFLIKLN